MEKRQLLLADDSMTIQKVVNLTFADENIEVVAVGDGDQAIEKLNEASPDLVLADVNMPGLDGYQVCERIKQNEATKNVPVILLVGSFEPFDERRAEQVGADDFLTKPFQSIRQLVSRVNELLDRQTDEEDFPRPTENPDATIGSFADTLEMPPPDGEPDTADESIETLGDAGMDDEMIQTAQIGGVPIDETHKYESAPIDDEDFSETAETQPLNRASSGDYPPAEDWAKTQPLSKTDLEAIYAAEAGKTETILDLEDADLFDFPAVETKKTSPAPKKPDDETFAETPVAAVEPAAPQNLSPESIEAIANRVAAKISNDVIERVVTEVLAQLERKE